MARFQLGGDTTLGISGFRGKMRGFAMSENHDKIFSTPPRKAESSHEFRQSLDDLSMQEIAERITTLQAEITRLEEARRAKQTSLSAAAAFFKFDESS